MQDYEQIRPLGRGTFGATSVVKKKSDSSLWVLKKIFFESGKKSAEYALKEVAVLKYLNNQCHFVEYEDSFIMEDCLFIVMEFCPGGDLRQVIKRASSKKQYLDKGMVIDWAFQIALGLSHLHFKRVLHRDLKPENVFLTEKQEAKLGDFGIATVLAEGKKQLTSGSLAAGTPYYLSPEVCEGQIYSEKSDVWAMGCLFYELLSLKKPFQGNFLPSLVLSIVKGRYPPLPPGVSPEFRHLVGLMLKQSPSARPSAREVVEVLSKLIKIDPISLLPPLRPPSSRGRPPLRRVSTVSSVRSRTSPFLRSNRTSSPLSTRSPANSPRPRSSIPSLPPVRNHSERRCHTTSSVFPSPRQKLKTEGKRSESTGSVIQGTQRPLNQKESQIASFLRNRKRQSVIEPSVEVVAPRMNPQLGARIEELRDFCEEKYGRDFWEAYKAMTTQQKSENSSPLLDDTSPLIRHIRQLLTLERQFFC